MGCVLLSSEPVGPTDGDTREQVRHAYEHPGKGSLALFTSIRVYKGKYGEFVPRPALLQVVRGLRKS